MRRNRISSRIVQCILVAVICAIASVSCAEKSEDKKTIPLRVTDACSRAPVGHATVFCFKNGMQTRELLGYTDDLGQISVTIEQDISVVFIETKYHHTVALFIDGLEDVGVIDVSLPVWSIR